MQSSIRLMRIRIPGFDDQKIIKFALSLIIGCGSALVSIRIRIQHFRSMRMRIQGFDVQNIVKFASSLHQWVVDPHWFHCGSGSRALMTKNCKICVVTHQVCCGTHWFQCGSGFSILRSIWIRSSSGSGSRVLMTKIVKLFRKAPKKCTTLQQSLYICQLANRNLLMVFYEHFLCAKLQQ
jgi:hypothetical protein